MSKGKFKHRITIQKNDPEATNENGFPLEDPWVAVKTVWSEIKTVKGQEYHRAATTQNENTARFIIRYTTGLDPDMRIQYKNRVFYIESIINDDEMNKTLTIITKEVI